MISKIIQKEKERQESFLKLLKKHPMFSDDTRKHNRLHNQSLINLKEYMEEECKFLDLDCEGLILPTLSKICSRIEQLREDIKELKEMIDKYGN